jgi:hypothetical protein
MKVKDLIRKSFEKWKRNSIHKKLINYAKSIKNNNDRDENSLIYDTNLRNSINKLLNYKKDNIFTKRYFLYKWREKVKNIKLNEIKRKFLRYVLENISKKNILYNYFSRWKNILKKSKYKKKKIKNLIKLTYRKVNEGQIIFLRELIRKWRFLCFAKAMSRDKILKMYEVMQKSYFKMSEDIYDLDKKNKDKYEQLNIIAEEDENAFVDHIKNLYNSKINNQFKFNYK